MHSTQRPLTTNQRARRFRILKATQRMVTEHGYSGTIMRDVAALADVSATTLYNLYNTKDELLLAALTESIVESAQRAHQDAGGPGYRYLLAHAQHVAEFTRTQPSFVSAISEALFRASPGDALVVMLMDQLCEDARKSLDAMAAAHELAAGADLSGMATRLTGAFWATFLLWSKGLIQLDALEDTLRDSYLSVLIPASQGDARTALEVAYASPSYTSATVRPPHR